MSSEHGSAIDILKLQLAYALDEVDEAKEQAQKYAIRWKTMAERVASLRASIVALGGTTTELPVTAGPIELGAIESIEGADPDAD